MGKSVAGLLVDGAVPTDRVEWGKSVEGLLVDGSVPTDRVEWGRVGQVYL